MQAFFAVPLSLAAVGFPLSVAIFSRIVRPAREIPWLFSILTLGAAIFVSSVFMVASQHHQRLGLGLAAFGSLVLGGDLLLFNDAWARFNQRWSAAFVRWEGSYGNSRAAVLVVGSVSSLWGIAAGAYALVGRIA